MIHQRTKDLFLVIVRPIFWLNCCRLRLRRRWPRPLCLQLGAGPNYWPGFINIDMNPRRRVDFWLDIRLGLPLPNASVDFIYAAEVFEHFYPDELNPVLAECFRVLRPGGGLRIVVPDLASAVAAYQANRLDWFNNWPRDYRSAGGRIANFLFCDGQHKTAFDRTFLEELLQGHGFQEVRQVAPEVTEFFSSMPSWGPVRKRERRSHQLLYIEALKGGPVGGCAASQ